jgi:hypothetical protein
VNKKLMLEPTGITTETMETRGQWTYATLRPLDEAWRLALRSSPKSHAIYYPKSSKRSEQPREWEDAQEVRPLLCYPLPAAPLS